MIATRNQYEERVYELPDLPEPETQKRLLMLEDDLEFSRILKLFLETNGYQVTCVPDGVSGLKSILAEDPDIILCDLMMPSLPGDLFYIAVERTKPRLCKRFIFMTGHRAEPKWDAFFRRIRACVLWKPFPLHELKMAVETILCKVKAAEMKNGNGL